MTSLLKASLKTDFFKKETYIFLAFSLFPFMIIIVDLFSTNFMQISAGKHSMDCLTFFEAMTYSQFQLALPLIVIIYLATTSVHDEIKAGILYIYKDISRAKILNSKLLALLIIYWIYFILTFIFSVITYYSFIIHQSYASGKFMPSTASDLSYVLITIFGIVLMTMLIIILAVTLSTKFNNGITMLVAILFTLISFIAPQMKTIKYIFPNSYDNLYSQMGTINAVLVMVLLFAIYATIFIFLAHHFFKRIEF